MLRRLLNIGRTLPQPVLLAVMLATALRIGLLAQGQYLFPDESRYDRCLDFWDAVAELNAPKAVTLLFKAKGRPGAVAAYLPVSFIQWSANRGLALEPIQTSWIPALFTALLGAVNTLFLYHLSMRLLKDRGGAILSTVLFALAGPNLYYVQFLLPYIAAQTFLLGCLLALPDRQPIGPARRRRLWCGVLFGLAFATYPGCYDQLILVFAVALALRGRSTISEWIGLVWIVLGLLATLLAWELCSRMGWGPYYVESLVELQRWIIQGAFAEVWRYPMKFLAAADAVIAVCLLIGLLGALRRLLPGDPARRTVAWLLSALLAWYAWRLLDAALERQVLYGRLVFQILPALALIAGAGLSGLKQRVLKTERRAIAATLLLGCWAFYNVRAFFGVTVPAAFEWHVLRDNPHYRVVAYVTSLQGTNMMAEQTTELQRKLTRLAGHRTQATLPVVLGNVAVMQPARGFRQPAVPPEDILARARHPLNIPALQFDIAYGPLERQLVQRHDLELLLLKAPAFSDRERWLQGWGGYKAISAVPF